VADGTIALFDDGANQGEYIGYLGHYNYIGTGKLAAQTYNNEGFITGRKDAFSFCRELMGLLRFRGLGLKQSKQLSKNTKKSMSESLSSMYRYRVMHTNKESLSQGLPTFTSRSIAPSRHHSHP